MELIVTKAQQDHFLKIFFTCMAIQHPELEAEYVALIFTVDGMQHTLLQGIPCPSIDGSGNYQLSRTEFVERRVSYLDRRSFDLLDVCIGIHALDRYSSQSRAISVR